MLLILLLVAFIVWLFAMIVAYQYGRIGRLLLHPKKALAATTMELPPLSIIIPTHNQATALRRHLPLILEQDYDRFEVIVIDMNSTDETKDVLERLELQDARLRHTSVPASARDISVERLALTLGFRAAIHDWVVITHPNCAPISQQWLLRFGETIVEPHKGMQNPRLKEPDMVLGIVRYDEKRNSWLDHKVSFYRLWNEICHINHVLSGHAAVRAEGDNMAYRKSFFLEQNAFASGQGLKGGAEELMVNQTSTPENTALMITPSAMVIQESIPSRHLWKQHLVFYAETRRHQRNAGLFRFKQTIRLLAPWLVMITMVVPWFVALAALFTEDAILSTGQAILMLCLLTILLASYTATKLNSFHKTTKALRCRNYYLSLIIFELQIPFWNFSAWLKRRFASRNEFRKKFV